MVVSRVRRRVGFRSYFSAIHGSSVDTFLRVHGALHVPVTGNDEALVVIFGSGTSFAGYGGYEAVCAMFPFVVSLHFGRYGLEAQCRRVMCCLRSYFSAMLGSTADTCFASFYAGFLVV